MLTEGADCLTELTPVVVLPKSASVVADCCPVEERVGGMAVESPKFGPATPFRARVVELADLRGDSIVCPGDCPNEDSLLNARL